MGRKEVLRSKMSLCQGQIVKSISCVTQTKTTKKEMTAK